MDASYPQDLPATLAPAQRLLTQTIVRHTEGGVQAIAEEEANEDIPTKTAVLTLLHDPEWAKWSDREIARRCAVDHVFVGKMRSSLVTITSESVPTSERTYTTCHGTQATMDTSRIGKTLRAERPDED